MINLSRPATLGDVIAWIFAISTCAASLACLKLPFIIPKFTPMFESLHAKLPPITMLVLCIPGFVWAVVPICISCLLIKILLTTQRDGLKVIAAVSAQAIVWAMIGAVVLGILCPILELQKQLS